MLKKALSMILACALLAALSITAFAASDVKIMYNSGMNEKSLAYVIPNATAKGDYSVANPDMAWIEKLPGYAIKSGAKIDIGDKYWRLWRMEEKNGKLVPAESVSWDKLIKITGKTYIHEGYGVELYEKGSTLQINAAGYYMFDAHPMTPMEQDTQTILVVEGGSASTETKADKPAATAQKDEPAATAPKDKPAATTQKDKPTTVQKAPADKNTVIVAEQERTPGQIQKLSSGDYLYTVNNGDTLYDLAERFYGNGGLWKELQKANQKYLDETKDGRIFVGFNLLIPAELGGTRANV